MKAIKLTTWTLAIGLLFGTVACKKYEDGPGISFRTKKSRLTGTWDLKEVDNQNLRDGEELIWTISKSGNFSLTQEYRETNGAITSTLSQGQWKWENKKKEIEFDYYDGGKTDVKILRLTNKELWFEFMDGKAEYHFEKK